MNLENIGLSNDPTLIKALALCALGCFISVTAFILDLIKRRKA